MNNTNSIETAVLGGGCFWCVEPVFLALKGVLEVLPGYCGGHVDNPSYEQVCEKNTGHIEVVQVRFDPAMISFESLLQIFFTIHDPTTLDRQGNDVGPQYASAIFYQSEQQKAIAQELIAQVQELLDGPIVTQLRAAEHFWAAEDYHHDYYARHPGQGYCQVVIAPKLAKFRQHFAALLA